MSEPTSSANHNMCDECWENREPGRLATRVPASRRRYKFCCFCAIINNDGIFVRETPNSPLLAQGHEALHALNEGNDNVIA